MLIEGLSLFRYITLRTVAALVTAFALVLWFGPQSIRTMGRWQKRPSHSL